MQILSKTVSTPLIRPSIVIAGTNSGCGKTTLSIGIMAALVERGLKVQPFKVGPDFIDPMFHTFVTGRNSLNLDSWMLQEKTVQYLFAKHLIDADIAIIEGVMGLYDGYGGISLEGSTADVSKIIGAPVILVISGEAMSLSAAALVKGFVEFDKNVNVQGIVINNVSSPGHYKLLKEVIEENTGVAVLGYIRTMGEVTISSRHLGLVTSAEIHDLKVKVGMISRQIKTTVDLDLLLKLAGKAKKIDVFNNNPKIETAAVEKLKIAVAKDKAFCFYYQDNLELLEMLGAEVVFFSPVSDDRLPENVDGLYIGGGYPEIWAEELQNNLAMRMDIKSHVEQGLPTYAECGGLMYLTDSIRVGEDREFAMVGLIPGKSSMSSSLKRFGYVYVKLMDDTILAKKGSKIRAHEFHYSETVVDKRFKPCFEVSKRRDGLINQSWYCGYQIYHLLAGYAHIHFWSNPEFARNFVKSCAEYRARKNEQETL
ncbi:Cobyrinic acid A,C-diamide synthase [Sporotomaculum syntrophicum]|uniref:Cobyrinate a,c-diamide synthase n=1 Tax=Sporotomaculum syntrophicum TaxID=182264 RepID=A0A9D3AY82_9FIRM|nr:cobyrinate a,c-diamide synthase [Sporotomaculum syntrophicum]KAF1084509.1 Cobyrinic acid A,C-diamide synthase [Sporotomaculum syntrophicum]